MKDQLILASLLPLFFTCLTSCSKPGSAIIGTWSSHSQFEYGTERSEFFKDGACFLESHNQRITGAWSALDDGRIRVTVTLGGGPGLTMFANVSGEELILDAGPSNRTVYVREQSPRAVELRAAVQKAVSDREIRIEAEKRAVAERQAAEARQQERQREADRVARAQQRENDRVERERKQEAQRAVSAGMKAYDRGLYKEARSEWERGAELGNVWAINNLAWHYAACKDASLHNGKKAVDLALKATKLEPNEDNFFGTLAAAYARNGQFDEAVKAQVRALAIESNDGGEERLKLYRQRKAYQEN